MPAKSRPKRSWFQRLKAIFSRDRCYKLIEYHGTLWRISGSADVDGMVSVDLKEITKHPQEVTQATTYAMMLDDYQFLLEGWFKSFR